MAGAIIYTIQNNWDCKTTHSLGYQISFGEGKL